MGPEQALAMLQRRIELDELNAYETATLNTIGEPLYLFRQRILGLFGHFSLSINESSELMTELRKDDQMLRNRLKSMVSGRRTNLQPDIQQSIRNQIRLSRANLATVIAKGSAMLESEYRPRVLGRMTVLAGAEFWTRRELRAGDWEGLARQLLAATFSPEIAHPLEDGEARFQLQVNHMDFGSYISQLMSGEHREDLDSATTSQAPPSQSVVPLPSPMLPSYFRHVGAGLSVAWSLPSLQGYDKELELCQVGELMLRASGDEVLQSALAGTVSERLQKTIALRDLAQPLPLQLF